MLQRVSDLPEVKLAAWSQGEFDRFEARSRLEMVRRCPDLWTVTVDEHIILIAGIKSESLIGSAELWVLVTEDFRKNLRLSLTETEALLPRLKELYPHAFIRVEEGSLVAERFAAWFGFYPVDRDFIEGHWYTTYEQP